MRSGPILLMVLSMAALPGCDRGTRGFTQQSYDEAWSEARASGRLFLVDSTATWCGPCKMMERTTWKDDRVLSWIGTHALAVRLDVDRDPKRAEALKIEAMPTIVVFKDGAEFDRVVGYQSADELLEWLEGLLAGRRAIDALREAAGDRAAAGGRVDVQARYRLAQALVESGELDEATGEYVWLWEHMLEHEPAMYGVRLSFMVSDMQRLAARHEPARKAFAELRDHHRAFVDQGRPRREDLVDWIHLNQVIGDEKDTIEWFDRTKGRPDAGALFGPVGRELFDLLVQQGRWADAGAVHPDPVAEVRDRIALSKRVGGLEGEQFDEAERSEMARYLRQSFREEASRLYAACLAAGRDDAAGQVALLLLEDQDDAAARQALVEAALSAGQPRPQQRRWLEEAQALGGPQDPLRRRLEQALGND